jgi:hypothetical protein
MVYRITISKSFNEDKEEEKIWMNGSAYIDAIKCNISLIILENNWV